MVRAGPHPALREHVRGYTGWEEWTPGPMRRRELPSVDVPLILNLGSPFTVRHEGDPPASAAVLGSFTAGLDETTVLTEHPGSSRGVQVDLTPIGARMILGLPMHEIAGRSVALADLLGPDALRLEEALDAAPGWDARFALIDRVLARRLAAATAPAPDVRWAWARLLRERGAVRVGALAREIGCSRRHLAARFHDAVGVPPRTAARLMRFEAAVDALRAPAPPPLAALAVSCGYHDQAHMTREVRALAGMPPRALVAAGAPADGGVAGS